MRPGKKERQTNKAKLAAYMRSLSAPHDKAWEGRTDSSCKEVSGHMSPKLAWGYDARGRVRKGHVVNKAKVNITC